MQTIKTWIGGAVLVAIAAYVYWVGGINVVWYAAEYSVPTDKVYIDPEPSDCDFWHAPLGLKGCHYEKLVFAHSPEASGKPDYRYDAKTGELIELRTDERISDSRPSEKNRVPPYDSVFVTWVKKSE